MKRLLDFQAGKKGYLFGGLLAIHALTGLVLAYFNAPSVDFVGFLQANQATLIEAGAGLGIIASRRAVDR